MEKKRSGFRDWFIVLMALADDVAALVLVLVVLWFFGIEISLWGILILTLVLGGIIFFIHRAVIPSLRLRKKTGAEGMEGTTGRVIETLKPEGTVQVAGEYWKARSVNGNISTGEEVEVIDMQGLVLRVKRKE